ncbi:TPA: YSIRK-type signal peptide-containing protein [Streptococcus equi subsp. zooepidemicus]|nr:YSIRK-type signal peptide-containing protein [Streptococcus equi subsp. zooepidemicus]
MEKKERFSLRKYKSGMVSVLIGILFLTGMGSVAAEEQGVSSVQPVQVQESREVLSVSQTSEGIAVNAQDIDSQSSKDRGSNGAWISSFRNGSANAN